MGKSSALTQERCPPLRFNRHERIAAARKAAARTSRTEPGIPRRLSNQVPAGESANGRACSAAAGMRDDVKADLPTSGRIRS